MGLTVLDAGVVIAILDARDTHHAAAMQTVAAAVGRGDQLILPASAYAEVLVAPHRRGTDAAATVDAFVDALPARVEAASRTIAATAARLRARHGNRLRLPDALVVATAMVLQANRVITTDAQWPKLAIQVDVLTPDAT